MLIEQFDDIRILKYEVPAFKGLTLKEKLFIYYMALAADQGRDILWDQNCRYNLEVRSLLETIIKEYKGDRETPEFLDFIIYAKKVFFANGVHHHYSMMKFSPKFSKEYFQYLLEKTSQNASEEILKLLFDAEYMNKRVVLDQDKDLIEASANNYYYNLTQKEVTDFYTEKSKDDPSLISYGLNSRLVKMEDKIYEEVWKQGGKYDKEISAIIKYLDKAKEYSCTSRQEKVVELLIEFYKTGDLAIFDAYSIEWLKDTSSNIDFLNGFIEVYGDPLAYKASWEAMVQIVDKEACARPQILAKNALWFEQNAPINSRFKKSEVTGVTAKVMQVAMLGGDCYPATPIGINLPNAEWIRETHGSKSVTLDNITQAYDKAAANSGVLNEFAENEEEIANVKEFGSLGSSLHTDLHECLGHGSGVMLEGITTEALKNYYSTLEEARADLFALYYIMDPKLIELGLFNDSRVGKTEYDSYIRNGLITQLTRVTLGENLEESHMRNRQIIASWSYEKGKKEKVIEKVIRDNKTYFKINDYSKLREIFALLLAEVQRIKSEGDFESAKDLVENYGVKIDIELHREVLERYNKLGVAPYSGFINPIYTLVKENKEIKDVVISYPESYLEQMLSFNKYQ